MLPATPVPGLLHTEFRDFLTIMQLRELGIYCHQVHPWPSRASIDGSAITVHLPLTLANGTSTKY